MVTDGALIDIGQVAVTVATNDASGGTGTKGPPKKGQTTVTEANSFTINDAGNDAILKYRFWDDTTDPASGHFEPNGTEVPHGPASFEITAAQLADLTFVPGTGGDDLLVRAFDGQAWSDWHHIFG